MQVLKWLVPVLAVSLGCRAGPTRREAVAALGASWTSADSAAVVRVWADGPPWFSCSEVTAKLRSEHDHAVVRDALKPWRSLVLAEWVHLRDTSAGPVSDPGWCVARLKSAMMSGWNPITGATLPSGGLRRGWDVSAGVRRIEVNGRPKPLGGDTVKVNYFITIAPNENGKALGVASDTSRVVAVLERENGGWRVRSTQR